MDGVLGCPTIEVPLAPDPFVVGLVSDTHKLMRPQAIRALTGSHHILHAGDIGSSAILSALAEVAPLTSVRGNNDQGDWASDLPEAVRIRFGRIQTYLLHDVAKLQLESLTEIAVVVAGHSHRPMCEDRDGILYVNPGSAGPRRFKLPVTVARLTLSSTQGPAFELVNLEV